MINAAYDVLKHASRPESHERSGSNVYTDPRDDDDFKDEYTLHFAIAEALHGTVHPFDKYQGPYIILPGAELWITPFEDSDFLVVYNAKNEMQSEPFWPHGRDADEQAIASAKSVLGNSMQDHLRI